MGAEGNGLPLEAMCKTVAKRLLKSSGMAKKLLELKRSYLRLALNFYAGHNSLRDHLKNMGMSDNDSCRRCQGARETTHLIMKSKEGKKNINTYTKARARTAYCLVKYQI